MGRKTNIRTFPSEEEQKIILIFYSSREREEGIKHLIVKLNLTQIRNEKRTLQTGIIVRGIRK